MSTHPAKPTTAGGTRYWQRRTITNGLGACFCLGLATICWLGVVHAHETSNVDGGASALLLATVTTITGLIYLTKTLEAVSYLSPAT